MYRHQQELASSMHACRNHGVPQDLIERTFAAAKAFHDQPLEAKMAVVMDELGVGYMPLNQRKLPTREKVSSHYSHTALAEPGMEGA